METWLSQYALPAAGGGVAERWAMGDEGDLLCFMFSHLRENAEVGRLASLKLSWLQSHGLLCRTFIFRAFSRRCYPK